MGRSNAARSLFASAAPSGADSLRDKTLCNLRGGAFFKRAGLVVDKAAREKELAASNADVLFDVGLQFHRDRDPVEAARMWRLAADKGHTEAQRRLGICYSTGQGVPLDLAEGARLVRLAYDNGHIVAAHELALCHFLGSGVRKDRAKAARLFRLAANKGGVVPAALALGRMHHERRNYREAARWFTHAARRGNAEATYELAVMMRLGQGVVPDYAQAARLFRETASKGYPEAQHNLGNCYHEGIGVQKDLRQAVYWYRQAAEAGHTNAEFMLGKCYLHGMGVRQDPLQAQRWLSLAASKGHADARRLHGRVFRSD